MENDKTIKFIQLQSIIFRYSRKLYKSLKFMNTQNHISKLIGYYDEYRI